MGTLGKPTKAQGSGAKLGPKLGTKLGATVTGKPNCAQGLEAKLGAKLGKRLQSRGHRWRECWANPPGHKAEQKLGATRRLGPSCWPPACGERASRPAARFPSPAPRKSGSRKLDKKSAS